jgi:repressor LexA
MAKQLTERQTTVLEYIQEYIFDNSYPPTIREIAENFNISIRGCYDHIKALEKKKHIQCDTKKSRSIRVLIPTGTSFHTQSQPASTSMMKIPILGHVQAGLPVLAEANMDGSVDMPVGYFGNGDLFALTVQGDSMIDDGIHEGDLAIIKQQKTFENGETIVVETENGVTLKHGYLADDHIKLIAANRNYQPIITDQVHVLGKLVGVIRRFT